MAIRIILADDHSILREGLKSLISKETDISVVAEAENGVVVLEQVRNLNPDVVVMDVAMPELNGIEATRQIAVEFPEIRVIALSMHSDRRFVIEMLRAGASAFVLKHAAFEELIQAIQMVVAGNSFLSSSIVDVVVRDYVKKLGGTDSPAYNQLTNRERQVLQMLAEGHSTKEIAFTLNVSAKTVETHRLNIRDKLGIDSLAELTKFAIREGLTTLD